MNKANKTERVKSERKALVFTIDALLALAAITIAATTFTVFETQTQAFAFSRQSELAQLGRDYLKLQAENKINPSDFNNLTGLRVSETETGFASNALAVRATLYKYPKICGCAENPCVLVDDSCLKKQDVSKPNDLVKKAWVAP